MKAPDVIYLQVDKDAETYFEYEDVTWCVDRINDTDTPYVLADIAGDLHKACEAFIEAYEKSLQLEKTDVALALAKKALARSRKLEHSTTPAQPRSKGIRSTMCKV